LKSSENSYENAAVRRSHMTTRLVSQNVRQGRAFKLTELLRIFAAQVILFGWIFGEIEKLVDILFSFSAGAVRSNVTVMHQFPVAAADCPGAAAAA